MVDIAVQTMLQHFLNFIWEVKFSSSDSQISKIENFTGTEDIRHNQVSRFKTSNFFHEQINKFSTLDAPIEQQNIGSHLQPILHKTINSTHICFLCRPLGVFTRLTINSTKLNWLIQMALHCKTTNIKLRSLHGWTWFGTKTLKFTTQCSNQTASISPRYNHCQACCLRIRDKTRLAVLWNLFTCKLG